jgi:ornithine cyclodeaminase/alanine dehydrogenase-like protein (mu-crystallin family)
MGADGPGKAEIAVTELARVHVFCDDWEKGVTEITPDPKARIRLYCDDWEQASHGGELAAAVEAGLIGRESVSEIGDALIGEAEGRGSPADITLFDSTGLALQDLAVALVAIEGADGLDLPQIPL